MKWFIFALIPPFIWSFSNHFDKYLIGRFIKKDKEKRGTIWSLLILSGLMDMIACFFIGLFAPNLIVIQPIHALTIAFSGAILLASYAPYMYALETDETSVITPLWQMVPIFGFILSFIFLKETLSAGQIFSGILIISGAVLLSLNIEDKKPRLKVKILLQMALAAFLVSVSILIFKIIALEENFWATIFWEYAGAGIFSLFILFIPSHWRRFKETIQKNDLSIFGINGLSDIIGIPARMASHYATLLAPIALVLVVNSLQPFLILLWGIIFTVFFPNFAEEKIGKKHMSQKVISIVIIFIGTYLLITR